MDYQSQASELKPMSASKVENQFNNLMFKRWLERMESVHILQYAVSTKSGTFWSTVEMHILWLSATCQQCSHWGEEHDRRTLLEVMVIDWIVSAPLLFSDQCPTIYHFLSACLFLLPLTPTSVLPHASCCPLFTVFCCVLSQAVPHPLSVSISLLAIYHPGPFKSIP